jgi:hypothetical protein
MRQPAACRAEQLRPADVTARKEELGRGALLPLIRIADLVCNQQSRNRQDLLFRSELK